MDIILYSTGCPRCNILKKKLNAKNIEYTEINDKEKMASLGIDEIPILLIEGNSLKYKEAINWVNEMEE